MRVNYITKYLSQPTLGQTSISISLNVAAYFVVTVDSLITSVHIVHVSVHIVHVSVHIVPFGYASLTIVPLNLH
jgi:hypothetical protein